MSGTRHNQPQGSRRGLLKAGMAVAAVSALGNSELLRPRKSGRFRKVRMHRWSVRTSKACRIGKSALWWRLSIGLSAPSRRSIRR